MNFNICYTCQQNIYFKNIIEGHKPGIIHKQKYYCNECIETVYFCEDLDYISDDKPIVKKNIQTTSLLICPYCKTLLKNKSHNCLKCSKIHPLYLPKIIKRKKNK